MTMYKEFYRKRNAMLSKDARKAKNLVFRICRLLEKTGGRKFSVSMDAVNGIYEGHIVDCGKCVWSGDECRLSDTGEDIGMIFWGGYFFRKKRKDAISAAWCSLLDDCLGLDRNIGEIHNLTKTLAENGLGPKIDFNFKSYDELEIFLTACGV